MHFECTVEMGQLTKQDYLAPDTESQHRIFINRKSKTNIEANNNDKGTGMHNVKVTEVSGKHISNALYLKSIHKERISWQSIYLCR